MRSANAFSLRVVRQSQPAESQVLRRLRREAGPRCRADATAGRLTGNLGPRIPTSQAERRQLTVMFCDLVGSTALVVAARSRGPARGDRRLSPLRRRDGRRFDGFVAKYMGDGVLVYFGYPQAHEDDAERAVRAGLALVDAVGHLAVPRARRCRSGSASPPGWSWSAI